MSVNQQRKQAMKRLMKDLEELKNSPVQNVSAAPLDENMFEWHCNFVYDATTYHVILFFPENYPFVSPSAEFVPKGYRFMGGAVMDGKKGVKVCLSIFSDFANYHTEWANEKSAGWSPGYTVQTVLLNMVSFISELGTQYGGGAGAGVSYADQIQQNNAKLSKGFKCKDCGHTYSKPYPPLENAPTEKKKKPSENRFQIVDYISKVTFQSSKPKSSDELFGFGLIQSGPKTRPSLTTPCEYIQAESFFSMQKSIGTVKSVLKEDLKYFLPMYISPVHGEQIKDRLETTMKEVAEILPKCNPKKTPPGEVLLRLIPNLMSATVVEFSKGVQHTSDNHLCGYFALHRLLLWAIKTYPTLQGILDNRLEDFIKNDERRSKSACPHIGEWLMLLSGSRKYKWQDAADAYLSESWRRNVMWYVKDDAKLGYLDTDKKYRLEKTVKATEVSRKLLAFQVLFLDIAMPAKMTRDQIIKRYDDNNGSPTDGMVAEMKDACSRIKNMKTYDDFFKVVKLKPLTPDEIFARLVKAVEFSINTNGYHWTFWKDQRGWAAVLKKYPNGTPGWKGKPKKASGKKEQEDSEKKVEGKGKGKGKGKSSKVEMEVDKPAPKGRGKRKAEETEEVVSKGRGRGRGVKKAKVEEEDKPAAGRGRGKAAAAGRGRGRKGKK